MSTSRATAASAGIKVFASSSMRAVLDELAPQFARASGHELAPSYDAANLVLARIRAGETADAVLLAGSAVDELIAAGRIVADSRADLARSGIGMAVCAGAPRPDIGTVAAFKRALLAANTIAYTTAGASGVYFATVIERLGIAAEVATRARTRPAGLIGELVASGEAEVAVQQIPELMAVRGIDLVGPLPAELHRYIVLSAGVFANAKNAPAARLLLAFLSTAAAASVFRAKGLEPL